MKTPKGIKQISFSLLTDKYGDMRDMTVNLGGGDECLVRKTESTICHFESDPFNLDGCKIKELEEQWGWKVDPKLSYSFRIYTNDAWVADQLKSYIRRKFGVVCAKAPYSSEVVLAKHASKLDDHLRQFLPRLPQIREDYFNNPPPPPPDKLQNPRHTPPSNEKRRCELCSETLIGIGDSHSNHMKNCHYTGPNAFPCDLCPCTFQTTASRKIHRGLFHQGAEPQKRNTFGIVDISDENAAKCDVHLDLIPSEKGSKAAKYRCMWRGQGGEECGTTLAGLTISRDHICSHLGLKPYKCPASGCNFVSSSFSRAVRHFRNSHEGRESEEEEVNEQDEEPPEKKTKPSAKPQQTKGTRQSY
ncbi:uncharacterized protein LOC110854419 isoform X1 [Folsomia candida]|uniref:uncharacterized protein LOC110854419 isoform X1 n=1 Tax=Folsomia candida TaxID=158441 RepID=UPI000B8FFCF5|nr:uncharacterized protein LOC110854419 isoform X1 [Folsomia candida]XP_035711048.1 uncharacterized protein LOC110854419 isoform X1 [Folsomia candida]XP_035711049.1 uncharacterized protein LOC110854419 isoform X1 [Folsomia candida]